MKQDIVKISSILLVVVALSIGISGCSNQPKKEAKTSVSPTTNHKKPIQHTHPKNECINAVIHTHLRGKLAHEHYYHHCKVSGESNAHVHPATKYTKNFRHVHPNGTSKHLHHK